MKIKLFYIHPTNYGNLMMACAFMKYFTDISFKRKLDVPEFYLDVLDDDELNLVKESLPEGIKIYREDLYNRKRRGICGKLEKLVNIPREILYKCKEYDMCVVLGGDCISQYYSTQVFVSDMFKFYYISKKNNVYLLGQTMGPFKGYAVDLVKRTLENTMIYVRDHDCYDYLKKKFDFKNLKESRDLAFLDIPYQNDASQQERVKSEFGIKTDYITIVPSGARRQYTSDTENYINEYIKIIHYIVDVLKYDVLLLAHVIHVSDSNDKIIIDEIVKKLEPRYDSHVHVIDHLIHPYEARILLGEGKVTITGRMHAAVSSINMGTVPICLSYSVKFKGVIGDDFGLNDYIYQCRGDDIWYSGNVSTEVIARLNMVLENRKSIVKKINDKLELVKKKSMLQIEELF